MHPILIDFGTLRIFGNEVPIAVRSYGTLFFLALLVGMYVVTRLGRRVQADAPWTTIYLGGIFAGVIGARVLNAMIFIPELLRGEVAIGEILSGGGTWLPGVLTGTLTLWWLSRRNGLALGVVTNVFFVGIAIVHAIGRVGCLLAGCCYGSRTTLPWAIVYTNATAAEYMGTPLHVHLHPTPVYEILVEILNFVLIWKLWQRRPRPWVVPAVWGVLYGSQRFLLEFLRGDPRGQFGPFSSSQWFSLIMVPLAALVLLRIRKQHGLLLPAEEASVTD